MTNRHELHRYLDETGKPRHRHVSREQLRADRREEGDERNAAWRAKSHDEQLDELHHRPGDCKKQIAKINKQIKAAELARIGGDA